MKRILLLAGGMLVFAAALVLWVSKPPAILDGG
jgi:hypothetical protein